MLQGQQLIQGEQWHRLEVLQVLDVVVALSVHAHNVILRGLNGANLVMQPLTLFALTVPSIFMARMSSVPHEGHGALTYETVPSGA